MIHIILEVWRSWPFFLFGVICQNSKSHGPNNGNGSDLSQIRGYQIPHFCLVFVKFVTTKQLEGIISNAHSNDRVPPGANFVTMRPVIYRVLPYNWEGGELTHAFILHMQAFLWYGAKYISHLYARIVEYIKQLFNMRETIPSCKWLIHLYCGMTYLC